MLKSFTTLLACFLSSFGPPSLPCPPPAAPLPDPHVAAPAPAPQADGTVFKQTAPPSPRLQSDLERLVHKYARRHGVDAKLIQAVLRQESGGNPVAVSPKGALGLMQLMPETAELLGVKDTFDPEDNLAGGVKYLKLCLQRFRQDRALALAAYNAGPGAVEKYGGVPPFPETRQYVASILGEQAVPPFPGKTSAGRSGPPQELESHQEAGLNWNLPQPTWKVSRAAIKVPTSQWKVRSSSPRQSSLGSKQHIQPAPKTAPQLLSRRTNHR